jgi:hypothetical protein
MRRNARVPRIGISPGTEQFDVHVHHRNRFIAPDVCRIRRQELIQLASRVLTAHR